MGVKDRLKQLGKIRVDFWNEGKPSSVTVDLPQAPPEVPKPRIRKPKPVIAPETVAPSPSPPAFKEPVTFEPSPAAQRLRKVLDEAPHPMTIPLETAPNPIVFHPQPSPVLPRIAPPVKAPSHKPIERLTCPLCFEVVQAWQTGPDGRVRCIPCVHSPKRGPQHVHS